MKFRLVESPQAVKDVTRNRQFKKKYLKDTDYNIKDFLVHHKDDTLVDGAKVTNPSNCVLIQKFPTDVNLTHSLVTNVIKCDGLTNLVKQLYRMIVLHVGEDGSITEQYFTDYLKTL